MKTSVEKLYFNWQDPNTGEFPKSYGIRVHAPGSSNDGDLKSRYLVKLLRERGSKVINFPRQLLMEIYDDCCWAFAGYLFTSSILDHLKDDSYGACPRNYAHMSHDEWIDISDDVTDCMRLRIIADASKYLEVVTATPVPKEFRKAIISNERIVKANEEYAAAGDWIISLEDQTLMPELTLILLGLRRGFWAAFHRNSSKFEPYDSANESYDDTDEPYDDADES